MLQLPAPSQRLELNLISNPRLLLSKIKNNQRIAFQDAKVSSESRSEEQVFYPADTGVTNRN